jgi:ABC-type microcin C transport system permease subunit YejE
MDGLDNKISFVSGFTFTALSSVSIMGVANAAMIGLVGGFFGLLGKELFYYIKNVINEKNNR